MLTKKYQHCVQGDAEVRPRQHVHLLREHLLDPDHHHAVTLPQSELPQGVFLELAPGYFQHLQAVSLATRVPVILGVITPATRAQALARTRGALDRGREAALAALEMAALRRDRPGKR